MYEGTVKKEVWKKVEISEKNCAYVAGGGRIETGGQTPQGPLERGQKSLKNEKKYYKLPWSSSIEGAIAGIRLSTSFSGYFIRKL
jgi:hypothetical protein